ncbi:flagellar biosynthesis protein FliQ [Vibrio parahaemolyticus AQ4037]|nr:flagellar biosynthesis protein FliQ [Vibrio parahaemolyticus AQ4037]
MTPEMFVELFREALWMVLIMVCAIIIPSLLIGLVVAIFQAATSINEQTLSLWGAFDRDFVSFDAVWSLDDPNADGIFLRLD